MVNRYNIGKIAISRVDLQFTIGVVNESIQTNHIGYICVTNARTSYLANHDNEYCKIQNGSLLTVPDGMPLIWIAHNLGYREVGRVCGPDLFPAMLEESKRKGYSHYFFGSTQRTIDQICSKMKNEYLTLEVKGAVSPPFQPLEAYDIDALAAEINRLKPTFFWCGLGAPKQERLMAMLQPKLESTICIGVGLVFEYFAGTVERAPEWAQKSGMEGFFRLLQQPTKISRMFKPWFWIFKHLLGSCFKYTGFGKSF